MPKVSFAESNALKTHRLAQFVRENGLVDGRDNGFVIRQLHVGRDNNSVGLFLPTPRQRKFLWMTLSCEWGHIGNIYTSDAHKRANNKNWVMEVHGRENLDRLNDIRIIIEPFDCR